MARRKITRAAARKIKDKWKAKNWYSILAPEMFEGVRIGETLSDDSSKLQDRITEVTMQDLTGDFSKMHIKLQFQITDIRGTNAHTDFIGHDMTSDYIRRQTRRKRSKMDGNYIVQTKDGYILRVKPMAITERRIQSSQQRLIRQKMENIVNESATSSLLGDFVKNMISGGLSIAISKQCKPIYPIKRVEIRKSEIMGKVPSPFDASSDEMAEAAKKAAESAAQADAKAAAEDAAVPGDAKVAKATPGEETEKDDISTPEEFTKIPGVGPSKAKVLFDAGYRGLDSLADLDVDELAKIEGIGPSLAKKIREYFT